MSRDHYDVVFVDEDLYLNEVQELTKLLVTKKRVFLSSDIESMLGFDITILKPFLPSQITDALSSAKFEEEVVVPEEEVVVFNETHIDLLESDDDIEDVSEAVKSSEVLDLGEIEKIKELLEMEEDDLLIEEVLSDEEFETRKVEVIKERLIADGLEIVSEDEYVEELGAKERKVSKRDDKEKLKKMFAKAVTKMSKKKIKKLLNGEKVKIKRFLL